MNKLVFFALTLIVGISLFVVVIRDVGIDKIANIVLSLNFWQFAALALLYGAGFLVSALRWKIILDANGNFVPFRKILAARMMGNSINYLTPSGLIMGEPFKAMILAGENDLKFGETMVSVVVEGAVYLSTLLVIVIIGVLGFISYSAVSQKIFFSIVGVLALLLAIFCLFLVKMIKKSPVSAGDKGFFTYLIALFRLDKISFVNGFKEKIARGEARIREFFSLHRRVVFSAIFLSLAEITIMLFAHWLTIAFLGFTISAKTLLGVFSLMSIANVLPLPASLGGFELSQIFAFSFFGLGGQAIALAFSLIVRIISLIYVMIGIAYLIHFEAKLIAKKIIEATPDFREKLKKFF